MDDSAKEGRNHSYPLFDCLQIQALVTMNVVGGITSFYSIRSNNVIPPLHDLRITWWSALLSFEGTSRNEYSRSFCAGVFCNSIACVRNESVNMLAIRIDYSRGKVSLKVCRKISIRHFSRITRYQSLLDWLPHIDKASNGTQSRTGRKSE